MMQSLQQRWRWGIGVGLVLITIILLTLATVRTDARTWFPIAISLVSLAIAVLSGFRSEIFPFRLKVFPGGLTTSRRSNMSSADNSTIADEFDLILHLSFLNTGYSDGIIDGVAVKVTGNSGVTMLYRPATEVDLKAFIQGPSVPNKANTVGWFLPFLMSGKQVVQKVWLFTQDFGGNPYPRAGLQPGRYRLDYFVKESRWTKARIVAHVEVEINEDHINAARRGVAVTVGIRNNAP